jgi:Ca2+-binding EF-hand superfamily protein
MSYGNYPPPGAPPPGNYGYGGQGGGYNQGAPGGYGNQGSYGGGGYSGGFSAHPPQGPPPGADPQLWQWFSAVDADRSNHISAPELQQALVNGDWTPFDLDTVKLLMSMFDSDRSGTIGFNEFSGLWRYIKDWQDVFRHFDKDRSGTIEGGELKAALSQFGYNLNPQLLQLLERKYVLENKASTVAPAHGAHGGYGQQRPPGITFDRFVRCCVVVRQLTEAFNRLDTQRSGWIQINYDTFMQTVLSAP